LTAERTVEIVLGEQAEYSAFRDDKR
jgi:hypothetical protein